MIGRFIESAGGYVLAPFQSREAFIDALSGAVAAVTNLGSKTAWLYLLSSFAIAGLLYLYRKRSGADGAASLVRFIFPREVYLHRSAVVDYKFVAIDLTIKALLYSPLIAGFSYLVYKGAAGAMAWIGLSPQAALAGTVAVPLLALVLGDFGFFLAHYLMHKIPVLWPFHEVHHSAEVLTPVTVYRTHPVEDLVNGVVGASVAGVGLAAFTTGTGTAVSLPAVFGVNIVQFIFFSFAFQLRHSHIWLSYGPILSRIFISPAQHQIHHSTDSKHWDKNFGFIFAFWDALFGSLYVPRNRETIRFGVPDANPADFSSVARLYFLPFAKAARRAFGHRAPTPLAGAAARSGLSE